MSSLALERVVQRARQILVLPIDEQHQDLWVWEHGERVMRLAQMLGDFPQPAGRSPDATALSVAALFHDAGWVLEHRQGRYERWQLLTRPTNDLQRELGAAVLLEEIGPLLPAPTLRLASDAIRQCNDRRTTLLEARLLADADALDEMGLTYVLRQFRQYQAEGRALQQLVDTWRRHKEYRYWEVRLADGFHLESARALARQRLSAIDAFMTALQSDLAGTDLADALRAVIPTPERAASS
jgi:hypothetical protein